MRGPIAASLGTVLALAVWPLSAARGPAEPPVVSLPALEQAVTEGLRRTGVPGASVVVIEGGQVVLALDLGQADIASGRAVTAETVFRAGSISKTFTAVAVMQLVEGGQLALDSPMSGLLPEWAVERIADPARPIRLAHLLEHTAGLDDIRFHHYLIEGADIPLARAVDLFGPYRARWRPGDGTAYSNAGPIVAGRVIERRGGQPFEAYMAQRVTGPLRMDSARWVRDPAQARRLATSYQADGRTPEPYVETPGRPSGSISLTARDLARLPLMFLGRGELNGQRLLSPASVERMERPDTSAAARRGVPIGWGLALRADPNGRAVFLGHDGSIDGFVARFAYAPALGAGYVIMANQVSEAVLDLGRLVRGYLERDLPPPAPQAVPLDPSQRERWAGQYQSATPRQELLRAVIGLTQWDGARFDGDELMYQGERWLHVGQGRFQRPGAAAPALLFIESPNGVELHGHDGAKRRVGDAERWTKVAGIVLTLAVLLAGLLALPFWAWAAWRGHLSRVGGAAPRLWPMAALAGAVAVPLGVLTLLSTGDFMLLGRPNPWSRAIQAASCAAPVVLGVAASALWRHRAAPLGRAARTLALLHLAMAGVVLAWLAVHGWIGIRLWDA
ncbi:serine hydrolase domain-containing protein [Rubrivivax albus]|uniref:Class A beta-lactamase-related serine hydrolase n=1 Tax=Rubrivivax albus TaxID=2499835 RepID=A0A3S2VWF8_9BURK|nr:serine hydrolase domain-containing protein [Rubrivivax albus]RVT50847.1 class A beta-lactamase-related serine hydrolase [Rubrivivax albus]